MSYSTIENNEQYLQRVTFISKLQHFSRSKGRLYHILFATNVSANDVAVNHFIMLIIAVSTHFGILGFIKRQRNSQCRCCSILQSVKPNHGDKQHRRLQVRYHFTYTLYFNVELNRVPFVQLFVENAYQYQHMLLKQLFIILNYIIHRMNKIKYLNNECKDIPRAVLADP